MRTRMKRFLGIMLSLALVLGLLPGMSLTVYARTNEVKNDYMGYGTISSGFDVFGVSGSNTISTTFSDQGYTTVMQVGNQSKVNFSSFAFDKEYENGGVKASVSAELIGQAVLVTYSLANTSNAAKTVKIGSHADVQIGTNDSAPVQFYESGILMSDSNNKFALVPNSDAFTTRWIGIYSSRADNVFNNSNITTLDHEDSGLAYSWTVELGANETATRTCVFAVGDVTFRKLTYNSNGEQGTMADMTIVVVGNQAPTIKLTPNKFTKEGYYFVGWSKTQNGEKEYDDGAQITGSATEDITLYAVWAEKQPSAVTAPTTAVENLKYTGSAMVLVAAGTAEGGEMQYAIGNDSTNPPSSGWNTDIPTATSPGTYYVWYKVVGDATHTDTAPECVTVVISKDSSSTVKPTEITLVYSGEAQELVKPGEAEGGTMQYALGTDATTVPSEGDWSTDIPKGTKPGTYYVWYMAKGDEYHLDSEPACITVIISEPKGEADTAIALPEGETTSVDTSKKPSISGGLAEQAQALVEESGDNVELKLVLTPKGQEKVAESTVLKSDEQMQKQVTTQYKNEDLVSVDVLEIDIEKYVNTAKSSNITETSSVIEIGVAYDFSGKYDLVVVRKHGTETEVFTALTERSTGGFKDATFYVDTANNMLYIYSNKFSTYVVAYSTEAGNKAVASSSSSSSQVDYPKTVPVYRLFNTKTGTHFLTANKAERDFLIEQKATEGWTDEGVAFNTAIKSDVPVYRVFDLKNGIHFYTSDTATRDAYIASGCRDEGIAWYAAVKSGRVVYKVTNSKNGNSLYTTNKAEADMLTEAGFTSQEAEFVVY